jgi:hypothetical protein
MLRLFWELQKNYHWLACSFLTFASENSNYVQQKDQNQGNTDAATRTIGFGCNGMGKNLPK